MEPHNGTILVLRLTGMPDDEYISIVSRVSGTGLGVFWVLVWFT